MKACTNWFAIFFADKHFLLCNFLLILNLYSTNNQFSNTKRLPLWWRLSSFSLSNFYLKKISRTVRASLPFRRRSTNSNLHCSALKSAAANCVLLCPHHQCGGNSTSKLYCLCARCWFYFRLALLLSEVYSRTMYTKPRARIVCKHKKRCRIDIQAVLVLLSGNCEYEPYIEGEGGGWSQKFVFSLLYVIAMMTYFSHMNENVLRNISWNNT